MADYIAKCQCYIHSLKDRKSDRNVLGEATIIKNIGDNVYLADYQGVKCTAILNIFTGNYFVDDVYGIQSEAVT
jgi:hypothetical protein